MTLAIISFLGERALLDRPALPALGRQPILAANEEVPTDSCALELEITAASVTAKSHQQQEIVQSRTQHSCPPPSPVGEILDASAQKSMSVLARRAAPPSLPRCVAASLIPFKDTRQTGGRDDNRPTSWSVRRFSTSQVGPSTGSQASSSQVACPLRELSDLYQTVATVLGRIAQANDTVLAQVVSPLATVTFISSAMLTAASKFQGETQAQPTLSLSAYAAHLARSAPLPAPVLVAALIAVDRISRCCPAAAGRHLQWQGSCGGLAGNCAMSIPPVIVSSRNVHRVLLITLSIAAKVHLDAFYSNKDWAKVGGISLAEFNRLELEFLHLIDYNLNVSTADYTHYCDRLSTFADVIQRH